MVFYLARIANRATSETRGSRTAFFQLYLVRTFWRECAPLLHIHTHFIIEKWTRKSRNAKNLIASEKIDMFLLPLIFHTILTQFPLRNSTAFNSRFHHPFRTSYRCLCYSSLRWCHTVVYNPSRIYYNRIWINRIWFWILMNRSFAQLPLLSSLTQYGLSMRGDSVNVKSMSTTHSLFTNTWLIQY